METKLNMQIYESMKRCPSRWRPDILVFTSYILPDNSKQRCLKLSGVKEGWKEVEEGWKRGRRGVEEGWKRD